ncbi:MULTISPECIES: response regulator [unclassified Massilia]|uniref:response regulator n=1 Tax=unclassified Massilia TaxID=2609279 RepID=UPI0017814445|nr:MULTISPECIES: response regulator [unclassified Massilia]MBD8532242.1 response regulator [Massilia sp. CFBP 13647]MBD8675683.1 response regulator [Massilia sp. CFBP 13721]
MPNFARSSLYRKLTTMSLLSTATALLCVFVAFSSASVLSKRENEGRHLSSLAGVVATSSADALVFNDRILALTLLVSLEAKQEISRAALYDRKGMLFATYKAPGRAAAAPPARLDAMDAEALAAANLEGSRITSPQLRLYRPVIGGTAQVGVLVIEVDLLPMWRDILRGVGVLAGAMCVSLLVSLVLARRFTRSITDPVTKLIAAAQQVSESQNTTLRVAHTRRDELGTLIDSFNDMLAQIEGRGAALTTHRDELERQVSVRTEQLERAKNAAEAASRAKSAFLATMSHEIRTPMNGVLGMTEMLLGTSLTEAQRNYTRLVKRSGEHLLVIINDILDFSKIEAGKLTIEYINFNLWDLLEDIHTVYTPQAQNKGIAFEFDIANDIPVAICGDPNRLRQIMANLLGNAIKFTERGRIVARVRVASEDSQAVVLRFEVIDTGIGIAREARGRLFEAFSQADDSTTRKFGGTGLGLAISKQLVELMGGAIGVDNGTHNGVKQGSVFWFTVSFDKRRVDPDAPGAAAPGGQQTLNGMRVLVVDEDATTRIALARHLSAWELACEQADGARAALELLAAQARAGAPFDAAILNMELRQSSGLLLAATIKADPLTRPTRLILLSPERLAADPVQRREAGVAYQLIEPARAADLFACLGARARGLTAPAAQFLPPPQAPRGERTARIRRVLLAEDNPVNVEVAKAMLESLGLQAQVAQNGLEALEAVRSQTFEAVLMDCQMPVMDGFAATAAIRREEQDAGRPRMLPVIAITANALQGDREACLAAGMDDYLSKPFTQADLAGVVGRWIAMPLSSSVHHDDAAPALPQAMRDVIQRDVINARALENIRALSQRGGDALVQKVISAYVGDTPQHLRTLRQAVGGHDAETVRRVAHSLKSASANVGAETLARLCKDLEQMGRNASVTGAATLLADMEEEFQAVQQSLNAMLV